MGTKTEDTSKTRDPLTRERVLAGALALADAKGIGALTMRNLAAALDRKPMALYHHVANKEELLDGMVDVVFAEIDLPDAALGWMPAMRQRADSARAVLLRHPWAVALMDSRTAPGPHTLRHLDSVIGCLLQGGFTVEMAGHAVSLLDAYIYGFVIQEISLPFSTPEEAEAVADAILDQVASDYPNLAELTSGYVLQPGYNYANEFHFGLTLILDGLERILEVS